MVSGPEITELVNMRDPATGLSYLAPTRVLRIPSSMMLEDVRTDRHGEYRQDDVRAKVTDAVIADGVGAYMRYAKGKRAIFFGVHRDHSKRVCAGLREVGIRAEHVDGDDPMARRDRIMAEFKTGGLDVVGNCQLIDEGFDCARVRGGDVRQPNHQHHTIFANGWSCHASSARQGSVTILDLAGILARIGLAG